MDEQLLTVLGLIAASLTSGAFFPQAYKVWRTKQHKDLALGTFVMLTVGILLWLVYGFAKPDIVIIFANVATLTMVAYILWVKLTVPTPAEPDSAATSVEASAGSGPTGPTGPTPLPVPVPHEQRKVS